MTTRLIVAACCSLLFAGVAAAQSPAAKARADEAQAAFKQCREGDISTATANACTVAIDKLGDGAPGQSGLAVLRRGQVREALGDLDAALSDYRYALLFDWRVRPVLEALERKIAERNTGRNQVAAKPPASPLEPAAEARAALRKCQESSAADSIGACTRAIEKGMLLTSEELANALYWRGHAYEFSRSPNLKLALTDFKSAVELDAQDRYKVRLQGLEQVLAKQVAAAPPQTSAPPAPAPAPAMDAITWRFLKDTSSVESLNRFIAEFPQSPHRKEAQERITALTEEAKKKLAAIQPPAPAKPEVLEGFIPKDEKRVALVIGNSAYRHVARLPNPGNDAADVAAALARLGFTITRADDSDLSAMNRALRDFGREAQVADFALVFFAGHGMEIGGENYLVPIDAELKRDIDVEQEAVTLKRVMLTVTGARKLGLVVLDACRDNPYPVKRSVLTRSVARGLAKVEPVGSVLVAYAAKEGTTADDGKGRNSPFTGALLHYLEKPGLEVNFLFRNVRDDVIEATNRGPEPFLYGSLSRQQISPNEPNRRGIGTAIFDLLYQCVRESFASRSSKIPPDVETNPHRNSWAGARAYGE
jgi:tetratricopeptide (TPR) repeat protein